MNVDVDVHLFQTTVLCSFSCNERGSGGPPKGFFLLNMYKIGQF